MSPKQVKITPGSWAMAIPSSTRPIGITQTGQPGPWTSSTFAGSRSSIAVLVDRVRVAAADLHQLVVAAGLDGGQDLARQRAAELGVAELVDVPHAAPAPIAVPAWTSSASPGATGATSAISTLERRPSSSSHSASPRPSSTRRTRIVTASSPQVMQ